MNGLDDATLIDQFIKGETLAANQTLRIESTFEVVQLLTKRGILLAIATLDPETQVRTIVVRQASDYWKLIHARLAAQQFILTGQAEQAGFVQYSVQSIPEGYTIHCTEARHLWRAWWTSMQSTGRHNIQMELLIFQRNTWYPIRDIICERATLFVKTLVAEVSLPGDELLVWLEQIDSPSARRMAHRQSLAQADPSKNTPSVSALPPTSQPQRPSQSIPFHPRSAGEAVPDVGHQSRESATARLAGTGTSGNADLSAVVRQVHGRLYISTALGEVVVEGGQLKVWLNQGHTEPTPKPVSLDCYRDRDSWAVNT